MTHTPRERAVRIDILSIFPDIFEPVLATSIPGRARASGLIEWHSHDIRRYSTDKHHKVDDRPFGGGPGMVMSCQPLYDAVKDVESRAPDRPATRVLMTPAGKRLDQHTVERLALLDRIVIIAGHYEGVDQRVIDELEPLEISVGDYVLSGGELPAMLLIDAIARLLPGALGHEDSAAEDSFSERTIDEGRPGQSSARLLDCPHYTRPREWMGREVPEVLMSGDHERVARWRLERMLDLTRRRRPDLLRETQSRQHTA